MFSKRPGSKGKLMVDKEARRGEAGSGIDFRALELEIDGEIDSLFVPIVQRAGGAKTMVEAHDSSKYDPDREKGKFCGVPGAGLDFGALQVEIDKEIDSLFVPAGKPDRNEGLVQTGNQEQPQTIQSKSPGSDAQNRPVAQNRGGPSPKSFEAATLRAQYDKAPPGDTFDSQKNHLHELSRLIEIFNAAYLSLDWEFSKDNIQKFAAALKQLEPFASRSSDAKTVLRIMDAILKRFVDRPHAVNRRLVQLIRDSQGLFAHLLLMESETEPHEKQRLNDLIERFQELRRRAHAVKAEAKRPKMEEILPEAMLPASSDKLKPPCEAVPAPALSMSHKSQIEEPSSLVDKSCRSFSENLEIMDTELASLQQIEKTLRGIPALVHIADRLIEIRSALKDQADILRDTRGEMKAQGSKGAEPMAEKTAVCEKTEPARFPTPIPVRHEDLYLIESNGECLELPASRVLKVARSPGKKGLKILKRGYATLTDFTPPFRTVKSGVLGEWTKLPAKELKSYRFEPLDPHSPDRVETSGPTAVLTSDGQAHRIIFGEIVNFISDAEISTGPPTEGLWARLKANRTFGCPFLIQAARFACRPLFRAKARRPTGIVGGNQWRPES